MAYNRQTGLDGAQARICGTADALPVIGLVDDFPGERFRVTFFR